MNKRHLLFLGLVSFLSMTFTLHAQSTVAKFKYEDAEKAYYANEFDECIQLLIETEELLGQTAPNILHLRILAQHKLFETNPYGSYEKLDQLRIDCNNYLTNYDITGLEEKYRDVYNIQNLLNNYAINEQQFNQKLDSIAANGLEALRIINRYIDAIGGREALSKVTTLFFKGVLETEGSARIFFFNKYILPYKLSREAYYKKNKKYIVSIEKFNGKQGFSIDSKGNKKFYSKQNIDFVYNTGPVAFPELYYNENRYSLQLMGTTETDHQIRVNKQGGLYENRYYDRNTGLLSKIEFPIGANFNKVHIRESYSDYKTIKGVKIPFYKTFELPMTDDIKSIYSYEEILINEETTESDFN